MLMFTLGIFGVFSLRGQPLSFAEPAFTVIVGLSKVGKKRTQLTHNEARYKTLCSVNGPTSCKLHKSNASLNDEHQTERTSALRSDDSRLTFKSAKGERRRKRKHVAAEVGLGPEAYHKVTLKIRITTIDLSPAAPCFCGSRTT